MAVSGTGDWLYVAALTAYVLERTQSPAWIAGVTLLRFLPHLLFGPIGGVLADRFSTRRVMVTADLTRVGLMLALAAAAASDSLLPALAIAFAATTMGVPYSPSVAAMTPSIVGERDLSAANAAMRVVDHLTVALGPALGSLVMVAGSPTVAFIVNAATFVVSALLVARVRDVRRHIETESAPGMGEQLRQGVSALRRAEGVSVLVTPFAAVAFTIGQAFVLLPLVSQRLLGTGTEGVGFLFAAIGIGGMGAVFLTGRFGNAERPGVVLLGAVCLSALALMGLAAVRAPIAAYALLAVVGGCNIILNVVAVTLIQRVLATDVIGRVFGILNAVAVAGVGAGSLAAPFVVETWSLRAALLIAGLVVLVLTLPAAGGLRRLDARSAAVQNKLGPRVRVLAAVPIFEAAPTAALELMARRLEEHPFVRGDVLVREGEPALDFYVLTDGRLTVSSHGEAGVEERDLGELGTGDHFGEIGLLEAIPRTATVTAASDGSVLRIPGESFLEALSQAPTFGATLMETAATRLARTHPNLRRRNHAET